MDTRLPTLADRADRALAGNSSGAFGAINVGLHNLGTFGTLESWSGYFREFPGPPFVHVRPQVLRANSPLLYLSGLTGDLRRHPLHVWLYSGTLDATRPQLMPFADSLRASGVRVQANVFPGKHIWSLWRAHMPAALRFANHWFRNG